MKLRLSKTSGCVVGALRLSTETFEKVEALAKREGVSNQEVIRAILDQVIDDIE